MRKVSCLVWLIVIALFAASCSGAADDSADAPPVCVADGEVLAEMTSDLSGTLRPDGGEQVKRGEVAPDFVLCDENGKTVRLSDYAGRPILLVFWAEWCGYCAVEMPTIDQVLPDLPNELAVIAVSTLDDSAVAWAKYRENGWAFTNAFDSNRSVAERYGVRGVPRAIFIDADGTVAGEIYGEAHFDKKACLKQLREFARGEVDRIVTAYCR